MASTKRAEVQDRAATVLRELLLLGKKRTFGDGLTVDEVSRIPPVTLRALVDNRDIELVDGDPRARKKDIEDLLAQVAEIRDQVSALDSKIDRVLSSMTSKPTEGTRSKTDRAAHEQPERGDR